MIICIGYERKTGEFEKDGKTLNYDNIVLHCLSDECGDDFVGIGKGISFKFKAQNFRTTPSVPVSDLVGKAIEVVFDVSGSVPKPNKVILTGEKTELVWDK